MKDHLSGRTFQDVCEGAKSFIARTQVFQGTCSGLVELVLDNILCRHPQRICWKKTTQLTLTFMPTTTVSEIPLNSTFSPTGNKPETATLLGLQLDRRSTLKGHFDEVVN